MDHLFFFFNMFIFIVRSSFKWSSKVMWLGNSYCNFMMLFPTIIEFCRIFVNNGSLFGIFCALFAFTVWHNRKCLRTVFKTYLNSWLKLHLFLLISIVVLSPFNRKALQKKWGGGSSYRSLAWRSAAWPSAAFISGEGRLRSTSRSLAGSW